MLPKVTSFHLIFSLTTSPLFAVEVAGKPFPYRELMLEIVREAQLKLLLILVRYLLQKICRSLL